MTPFEIVTLLAVVTMSALRLFELRQHERLLDDKLRLEARLLAAESVLNDLAPRQARQLVDARLHHIERWPQ